MGIRDYAKSLVTVTLDEDEFSDIICGLIQIGSNQTASKLLVIKAKHELSFEKGGDI